MSKTSKTGKLGDRLKKLNEDNPNLGLKKEIESKTKVGSKLKNFPGARPNPTNTHVGRSSRLKRGGRTYAFD